MLILLCLRWEVKKFISIHANAPNHIHCLILFLLPLFPTLLAGKCKFREKFRKTRREIKFSVFSPARESKFLMLTCLNVKFAGTAHQ